MAENEKKKKDELFKLSQARERLVQALGNEKVEESNLEKFKFIGTRDGKETFEVEGKEVKADEIGLSDLFAFSHVPPSFFKRCDEQLKGDIFKKFVSSENRSVKTIITNETTMKGVIAVETPYLNAIKVFDLASEVLPKDSLIQAQMNDGRDWYWNFVTEQSASPARDKGDITKAGVSIRYGAPRKQFMGDDVFEPSYEVGGFLFRLVCTNGLISQEQKMEVVEGGSEPIMIKEIQRLTSLAYGAAKEHDLEAFVKMAEVSVEDPSGYVNRLAKEGKIGGKVRDILLDRVPSLPNPATQYDLVNLITSTANDFKFRKQRQLQMVAGTAMIERHRCPHCHTKLNGK